MQGEQSAKSGNERNVSRLLVFKLGANGSLPPLPPEAALPLDLPPATADAATIKTGEALFARFCSVCHGEAAIGGGVVPDLRTSPFIAVDAWYSIVLDGALMEGGMAPFGSVLDRAQATAIRDYIHRANEDKPAPGSAEQHKPDPNHGQPVVAQGTPAAAPACAQCHAFTGSSTAVARSPPRRSVGILSPRGSCTTSVRACSRQAPSCRRFGRKRSSPDDIADVAAYYANVETPFPMLAVPDLDLVKKGRELAEAGLGAKGVPGCSACHGAGGVGQAPTVPYLAGHICARTPPSS